jgi:hypothetical protein
MANKSDDTGVINRLAGRGEEAVNRLMEELGKNDKVTDALARAMEAKGKVDERTRRTLGTVGVAAADQLEGLRNQIEVLEKRLAALETSDTGKAGSSAAAKRSTSAKPKKTAAKKTTTARKPSSSTTAKKKTPES